jgi:glyceraldehyde 3-phosphate dehydrogenase
MALRFAINGLGRIGRALLRIAAGRPELELVAVNDLVPAEMLARLVARDTVHGPFALPVEAGPGALSIGGRTIPVFQQPDPAAIDWGSTGVRVVVEATGRFIRRDLAAAHLRHGVERVIISANADPADPADATLCLGVNEASFDPARHAVVSNSSCTTNCLALVARVLDRAWGLRRGLLNVVHSYTENQRLLDLPHPDPRRARAAALNIIPTGTTAPHALGLICPALAGRVEGFAVRVPTAAVAMLDLVAELDGAPARGEVASAFRTAAARELDGLLGVSEEELVSSDFVGDPRSAIVDLALIQTSAELVRVVAWYDNEWGYATRLADLLGRLAGPAAARGEGEEGARSWPSSS